MAIPLFASKVLTVASETKERMAMTPIRHKGS